MKHRNKIEGIVIVLVMLGALVIGSWLVLAFCSSVIMAYLFAQNSRLKRQVVEHGDHLQRVLVGEIKIKDFDEYHSLTGTPVHMLAEAIFNQMEKSNVTNFYGMTLLNGKTGDQFEIMLQKVDGQTPLQQLHEARQELKKYKNK